MSKEILLCRNNAEKDDRTTSATRKPGFGGSLKGNLDFERQLIVDNLSETPGLRVVCREAEHRQEQSSACCN